MNNYQQVKFIIFIVSVLFYFANAKIIHLSVSTFIIITKIYIDFYLKKLLLFLQAHERLKFQCSSTSVKIFFSPERSYSSSLIVNSNENCVKDGGIREQVRFKFDFNQCTSGARKFNLTVIEIPQHVNKIPFINEVVIDCQKFT